MRHNPVLLKEVLAALSIRPGAIVMDGTLGSGGHSEAMLSQIGENGKLFSFDQDSAAIERCKPLFANDSRVRLVHENFRNVGEVFQNFQIAGFDAVLLDIGISSEQLADENRGFSFDSNGLLDMRMDTEKGSRASEILESMTETELADLFYYYGEERHSRRFAHVIVEARRNGKSFNTVSDLNEILQEALPEHLRFEKGKRPAWARRNPFTKVFQAIRIAVNDELEALKEGMAGAFDLLLPHGRLGIITFHSLEDRIVKNKFKEWNAQGKGRLVFKKPIVAERTEILSNPRSRSAKLRVIERIL